MENLELKTSGNSEKPIDASKRSMIVGGLVWAVLWNSAHARQAPRETVALKDVGVPNSVRRIYKKDGVFILGEWVRKEWAEDKSVPIASLTKLLTALVVYELCKEKGINVRATKIALNQDDKLLAIKWWRSTANSRVPIARYTIENLLDMSLIKSTNEATEALARGIVSREDFIKRMNQKAKALGMTHSEFDSPSWLTSGNVSSLSDLEKLSLAILNSPYPIGHATQYAAVELPQVKWWSLESANKILLSALPQGVEVVLMKTWYIRESGKCEVIIVKLPDWSIYSIILFGARDDTHRRRIILNTVRVLMKGA